jgi:hypothetical protein
MDQSNEKENNPTPPDGWADPRNFAVLLVVIRQRIETADRAFAKYPGTHDHTNMAANASQKNLYRDMGYLDELSPEVLTPLRTVNSDTYGRIVGPELGNGTEHSGWFD